jgi:SAM-dependent methyltransferase
MQPDSVKRRHPTQPPEWEEHYRTGNTPWDTLRPSVEMIRIISTERIVPCAAIELGCGTGSNTLWLAAQGFEVTGVDCAALALDQARRRSDTAGVTIRWVQADVLGTADLGGPYCFLFDRGCYHCVRRDNGVDAYLRRLDQILAPGASAIVLAGNAREPRDPGPPVVSEEELRAEFGRIFHIVQLREFRFDRPLSDAPAFLGWSCLARKRDHAPPI